MLKYDIYTTIMNYIPLLVCVFVIYKIFKADYLKFISRIFTIITSLLYFYLQFRWIIMDFEGLAALENLWSGVELMMMVSIISILYHKRGE